MERVGRGLRTRRDRGLTAKNERRSDEFLGSADWIEPFDGSMNSPRAGSQRNEGNYRAFRDMTTTERSDTSTSAAMNNRAQGFFIRLETVGTSGPLVRGGNGKDSQSCYRNPLL